MKKLKVTGVIGLDGEYDLIEPPYTGDEWHAIKVKTGLRLGDFEEAWMAKDADVVLALAWVTLTRAGHPADPVWGAIGAVDPFAAFEFDFTDEPAAEEDARPPDSSPTPSGNESSPVGNESENANESGTGANGSSDGGHLVSVPSPTGFPPSDIGVPSDPATSAL